MRKEKRRKDDEEVKEYGLCFLKKTLHWKEKWKIIGIIRIQPCMPVPVCVHEKVDHTLTQSSDRPNSKKVLHLPDFMRVHIFSFWTFSIVIPFLPSSILSILLSLSWSHQSSFCQQTIHRFTVESLSVWIFSFYLASSPLAALFLSFLTVYLPNRCILALSSLLIYLTGFLLDLFSPPLPSPDIWILHLTACWREREKKGEQIKQVPDTTPIYPSSVCVLLPKRTRLDWEETDAKISKPKQNQTRPGQVQSIFWGIPNQWRKSLLVSSLHDRHSLIKFPAVSDVISFFVAIKREWHFYCCCWFLLVSEAGCIVLALCGSRCICLCFVGCTVD